MTATSIATRRSLASGGVYALANAGQRALAFILLPIYTAALSPSEYGRLGLLLTIQGGASIALTAGMDSGVLRRYFTLNSKPDQQSRLIISSWTLLLAAAPGVALCISGLLIAVIPASPVFDPSQGAFAVCIAALFVAATVVPFTVLRAEQRLRDYVLLTVVAGGATTTLTVLFVVVLHLGVGGWLAAMMLSNCLLLAAAMIVTPWRRIKRFDRKGVWSALSLGLPLVPHAVSHWSLQLADRIALSTIVTPAALGVYTLGATLGLPTLVLVQSLNQGFMPSFARIHADPTRLGELRGAITIQVVASIIIGSVISIAAPVLVGLIAPQYRGAAPLIPWIAIGYIFLGLYYVPMNGISLVAGRTTFVWVLTVTAAMVNLGVIYLFAPIYGIIAAAIASAGGYFVLLLLTSIYAASMNLRLSVDWQRILPSAVVGGCAIILGMYIIPTVGVGALIFRFALLLVLTIMVWQFTGVSVNDVAPWRISKPAITGNDLRG